MSSTGDTSILDNIVVSLSQQLIDDFPAADPRWAESIPQGGATNYIKEMCVYIVKIYLFNSWSLIYSMWLDKISWSNATQNLLH